MQEKLNEIRRMLKEDGINTTLISKMTDEELIQADKLTDYDDYNNYMTHLAYKYDI